LAPAVPRFLPALHAGLQPENEEKNLLWRPREEVSPENLLRVLPYPERCSHLANGFCFDFLAGVSQALSRVGPSEMLCESPSCGAQYSDL
jgi:hypothetical protein